MDLISLRCRKICCIGRLGRLLQAVGSANSPPLPYYFVFCSYYTACEKPLQPALGPPAGALRILSRMHINREQSPFYLHFLHIYTASR